MRMTDCTPAAAENRTAAPPFGVSKSHSHPIAQNEPTALPDPLPCLNCAKLPNEPNQVCQSATPRARNPTLSRPQWKVAG